MNKSKRRGPENSAETIILRSDRIRLAPVSRMEYYKKIS